MELMQLRYFQVVAANQHITRSAEQLNVSQPAISTVIARLEHELGVSLFDRTGRSIVLNEYGKIFLKRVDRILLDIDNSKKELRDMSANGLQTISVSVTDPQYLQGIEKFIGGYYDIKWNQSVCKPEEILRTLESGRADIAITASTLPHESLVSETLFEDSFVVAVHKDHIFAKREEISLADLSEERMIALSSGFLERSLVDQMLLEAGIRLDIAMEGDIQIRQEMIRLNCGISLTTKFAEKSGHLGEDVTCIPVKNSKHYQISLVYSQGKYLSKISEEFSNFMRGYFKELSTRE